MPVSADINAQPALGSRKYALTPSTDVISWHQQESPVAKQAHATVTLLREQGGVSGEGSQSRRVCQCLKCQKSHPASPCLGTPGAGRDRQALCTWGGSLQEDDPWLFKPKLKGNRLLSRFLTTAQPILHEFIILLLVLKEWKRRFPETGNKCEILVCHMMNFSPDEEVYLLQFTFCLGHIICAQRRSPRLKQLLKLPKKLIKRELRSL